MHFFVRSVLGIEFNSTSLKVVHLKTGKKIKIVEAINTVLDKECVSKGRILDEDYLSSALKQVLAWRKIKEQCAVVILPGQEVVLRQIVLPSMPYNDLKEAVIWEAVQYLRVPKDSLVVDYKIIDKINGEGHPQLKIILAAVSDDTASVYYRVIKKAGLKPKAVDVKAFSVLRGIPYSIKQNIIAAVDFGKDETNVVIARNGVLQAARTIPHMPAYPLPDGYGCYEILNEIKRFIGFYSNSNKGLNIENVLVSGDTTGCDLITMSERIQNELGIRTIPVGWDAGEYEPPGEISRGCEFWNFIAPVGAAMWGIKSV